MPHIKVLISAIATMFTLVAVAQNTEQSPFSRFGIGDIEQGTTSGQRALGGTGIALSPYGQINLLNPGSAVFLSAPIFSVNGLASFTNISQANNNLKQSYSGLNNIALAFPIQKKAAFQFGLKPYSSVGYSLTTTADIDTNKVFADYSGSGGLKNAFLAISYDVFNKKDSTSLVLSGQLDYYFGPLTQSKSLYTDALTNGYGIQTKVTSNLKSASPYLAALYTFYPNKKKGMQITLGATYRPEVTLRGTQELFSFTFLRDFSGIEQGKDTIQYQFTENDKVTLPSQLGLGIAFRIKDKLNIGLDYVQQDWSAFSRNVQQSSFDGDLVAYSRVSFGAHYTPNSNILFNEPLWNFVTYSFGAWSSKGYLSTNGNDLEEFGTSFGLKFPFRKSRSNSALQLGLEYRVRGDVSNNLIQEKSTRIIFGLSLSPNFIDRWFYKRKYD